VNPAVSVIVPTHNRLASLQRLLLSLERQSFDAERMEVIVVADACSDGTAQMVHGHQAPWRLELLEGAWGAAGTARNAGAARAAGYILVFLDDDVEPAANCIAAHVHEHSSTGQHVSLGPLSPAIRGSNDFFRLELRSWWLDFYGAMVRPGYRHTFRSFVAGNSAMLRSVFEGLGGFDESIAGCGGEDWEFGVRMLESGVRFMYAPEAAANHYDQSDLDRSLQRRRQEGRAEVIIGRRHPFVAPALDLMRLTTTAAPFAARKLRQLAFVAPRMGDRLAGLMRRQASVAQQLRVRGQWRIIFGQLRDYWYWRGVADEFRTLAAARSWLAEARELSIPARELEVDLADGIVGAEARVDQEQPSGIRVSYRGQHVGRIPSVVAAEPLRGAHLRQALATDLADRLLRVVAVQTAAGSTNVPGWLRQDAESAWG
jgi:GT2 family glycosyltransferase